MDEDNLLADYDLSAWEVPPPAAGLADNVVRRAREPMPHAIAQPRSLKWWFVGGGVLAAVVAVLAIVMFGIERAPANGSGQIAANAPRSLDLGTTSAAIDSGAQLVWNRHGSKIDVAQSRGNVTWNVGGDDKLAIDAVVASIEATGASLRVEVEMNRSDVRAMGVGSASAIVVALVTVIVYEGHVKATNNGQTVNIQPGASMQFGPPPAPVPPPDQLNVGGGPEDAARIRELEAEVARLKLQLARRDKDDAKSAVAPTTCDAEGPRKKGEDYISNGMDVAALAQFEASLRCKPDLGVSKKAFLAACRSKNEPKAQKYFLDLPEAQRTQLEQICIRYGISASAPPPCDADAMTKKADDYFSSGMDAAALAQYEAALRCKYDGANVKKAYLAACRSKQQAKAKLYYSKLPANQSSMAQICIRYGIDPEGPNPPAATTTGTLTIASVPPASVQIDGVTVGTTPISKKLPAGKHKVTFVVGGNKYTYAVNIKANETTNLRKDFSPVD